MMMKLRLFILTAVAFVALPLAPSVAQVGISINFAPPPLLVEVQPPVPVAGYIWTPGYWAWGVSNYYWVPGAWVAPPVVGLLWTPPWWGWRNGVYTFNAGYWGPTVGFYGGINYGFGYFGTGYWGGHWQGNTFFYNTAVTHVNTTVIHNTFVDSSVNKEVNASHTSFNGPNGVKAEPTAEQKAAAENAKRMPPTSEQTARQDAASKDHNLQASENKGHPNQDAIKSFNQTQEHGKGGQGLGGAATGAGTGKAENKPGKAENLHGKQNLAGTYTKAHTSKKTGQYGGPPHGPYGTMQGPHHPPMTTYHPQGTKGGHPSGQQQGKKKSGKPQG